jgi:hypothetical protein
MADHEKVNSPGINSDPSIIQTDDYDDIGSRIEFDPNNSN